MKKLILIAAVLFTLIGFAQKPKVEAIRWNGMTTAERDALVLQSTDRWFIFNETTNQSEWWNGTEWKAAGANPSFQQVIEQGNTYVNGFNTWSWNLNGFLQHRETDNDWGIDVSGEGILFSDGSGSYTGRSKFGPEQISIGNIINGTEKLIKATNINTIGNALQLPNTTTPNRVFSVGITDGENTRYAEDNGIVDISTLNGGGGFANPATENLDMANNDLDNVGLLDVSEIVANSIDMTGAINMDGNTLGSLANGTFPNDAVNKSQLDAVASSVPSSEISYVRVTDSTYTLLEADILASKPHLLEAFRADGTTPADTIVVTYPTITHDNSLLITTFAPKNGSAIKLIPDTGVNDYKTASQKQYILPANYNGFASVSSDAADIIYPSSNDWIISDYTAPPPPSTELFQGNAASDNHGEVDATTGWSAVGQITITSDTTDPQTGSNHITITNTDAGGTGDRAQFEITVENGEQYEIRIWGREATGTEGRIQLFAGVSGWSTVQLTNTWTEYVQTVTATSTTMTMRFYPNSNGTASSDSIYIDNISVIKQ